MARLFIPGPTDVHPDVLAAQNQPMIGYRGKDFEELFARIQPKLRRVFFTSSRVYVSTSSGIGLQEAAIRNGVARKCCAVSTARFRSAGMKRLWRMARTPCGSTWSGAKPSSQRGSTMC